MLEISDMSVVVPPKRRILDSVSLSSDQGKMTAIIGPNGAGKSTLLKCIIGLVKPEKAAIIRYDRKELGTLKRKELSGMISYMPQTTQPVPSSVYNAVLLGRRPHISWRPGRKDHDICLSVIEELGLFPLKDECVCRISGGEFQKVLIARALVQGTPILLLDEPINHLDLKNQIEIMELMASLTKKHDLIVLVVLHNLNLAFRYADAITLMNNGKISYYGAKDALSANCLSEAYQVNIKIESFGNDSYVLF